MTLICLIIFFLFPHPKIYLNHSGCLLRKSTPRNCFEDCIQEIFSKQLIYWFSTIISFALNRTAGSQLASDVTGFEQFIQSSPIASYKDALFAAVSTILIRDLSKTRRWLGRSKCVKPSQEVISFYDSRPPFLRNLNEQAITLAYAPADGHPRVG